MATKEKETTKLDPALESKGLATRQAAPVEAHGATRPGAARQEEPEGFENLGADDYAIPFFSILQKGSPEVDPDKKDEYIPGSKPGMIMNSVTNELIDGKVGFAIVPVHRKHEFLEWIPRDQGGGLGRIDHHLPAVDAHDPRGRGQHRGHAPRSALRVPPPPPPETGCVRLTS